MNEALKGTNFLVHYCDFKVLNVRLFESILDIFITGIALSSGFDVIAETLDDF
jgi:hypothetical protein